MTTPKPTSNNPSYSEFILPLFLSAISIAVVVYVVFDSPIDNGTCYIDAALHDDLNPDDCTLAHPDIKYVSVFIIMSVTAVVVCLIYKWLGNTPCTSINDD